MSSSESNEFEDFIKGSPEIISELSSEQFQIYKEHKKIMITLAKKKFLSIKQIFSLFWNPEKEEHTKSLNTVYRIMNTLEKLELVKIAGFRKYNNNRNTEKLYCRTAKMYYSKDVLKRKDWWKTPEFQKRFKNFAKMLIEIEGLKETTSETVISLVNKYYEFMHHNKSKIFDLLEKSPSIVENVVNLQDANVNLNEIFMELFMIRMFRTHPDIIEEFKNLK